MFLADDSTNDLALLPVLRWADVAGGLTARTDGLIDYIVGLYESIPNNVAGVFLSMGNNIWSATARLVSFSGSERSNDVITATFGPMANTFVGLFYKNLTDSWTLLALGIAFVAVSSLWLIVRNQTQMAMRKCAALLVGLSLFLGMGMASANHPTDASPMTPYWLTQQASSLVGQVGDGISKSLLTSFKTSGAALATKNDSDNKSDLSCRRYVAQLDEDAALSSESESDMLLSSLNTMWEETGLRMWARAQYGSGRNGLNVFCRVLDFRAGADASQMAEVINEAAGKTIVSENAIAFHPSLAFVDEEGKQEQDKDPSSDGNGSYSKQEDRVVTMWQACGHFGDGFNVRNGWQFVGSLQGKDRGFKNATWRQMCSAVFTGSASGDVDGATKDGGKIGDDGESPDLTKTATETDSDKSWNAVGNRTTKVAKKGKEIRYSYPTTFTNGVWSNQVKPGDSHYVKSMGDKAHADCSSDSGSDSYCAYVSAYVKVDGKWSDEDKDVDSQTKDATQKDVSRVTTSDEGKKIRRLIKKFDVSETSGWAAVAMSNNGGSDTQKSDAKISMQAQHGISSLSDVGGAMVFAAAGIVNLMIWGVAFGIVSLLAQIAAYLLVAFGLWFGLLIYAFAPDKGRQAVGNALRKALGCCCAKTLVNIVAAVCCVFCTVMNQVLHVSDASGNSGGTVFMAGVAAALLPVAFFKGLQYLCVNVWRLGDPLSVASIGRLMSGKDAFRGLKAAAGGLAGFVGAKLGGGGMMAALGAAQRGVRSGSVVGSVMGGYEQGQRDSYYKGGRNGSGSGSGSGGGRGGYGPSEADAAAAGTPKAESESPVEDPRQEAMPTAEETAQAEEELGGDDREAVQQRALDIHNFNAAARDAAEALGSKHVARNVDELARDMTLADLKHEMVSGERPDGRALGARGRVLATRAYVAGRFGRAGDIMEGRMRAAHTAVAGMAAGAVATSRLMGERFEPARRVASHMREMGGAAASAAATRLSRAGRVAHSAFAASELGAGYRQAADFTRRHVSEPAARLADRAVRVPATVRRDVSDMARRMAASPAVRNAARTARRVGEGVAKTRTAAVQEARDSRMAQSMRDGMARAEAMRSDMTREARAAAAGVRRNVEAMPFVQAARKAVSRTQPRVDAAGERLRAAAGQAGADVRNVAARAVRTAVNRSAVGGLTASGEYIGRVVDAKTAAHREDILRRGYLPHSPKA